MNAPIRSLHSGFVQGKHVAHWVYEKTGGCVGPNTHGIGCHSNGILYSGLAVEGWNGHNVLVHQRHERRSSREFWKRAARYIFDELGCQRCTGLVAASNDMVLSFNKHIGFEHEATLKGAADDGGDLCVLVLWRDKCRFLNWR